MKSCQPEKWENDLAEASSIKVTIANEHGLHARPAARFVQIAGKYKECNIHVTGNDNRNANGKSIMGMLTLEAGPGTVLKIAASGDRAEELLKEIRSLVEGKFGEE